MGGYKDPGEPGHGGGSRDAGETVEIPEFRDVVPARNTPLIVIAILVTIFALDWAQPVLVPLVLGLIVSYALSPVVDRLERYSIRRGVSAAVLLLCIIGGIGAAAVSIRTKR